MHHKHSSPSTSNYVGGNLNPHSEFRYNDPPETRPHHKGVGKHTDSSDTTQRVHTGSSSQQHKHLETTHHQSRYFDTRTETTQQHASYTQTKTTQQHTSYTRTQSETTQQHASHTYSPSTSGHKVTAVRAISTQTTKLNAGDRKRKLASKHDVTSPVGGFHADTSSVSALCDSRTSSSDSDAACNTHISMRIRKPSVARRCEIPLDSPSSLLPDSSTDPEPPPWFEQLDTNKSSVQFQIPSHQVGVGTCKKV